MRYAITFSQHTPRLLRAGRSVLGASSRFNKTHNGTGHQAQRLRTASKMQWHTSCTHNVSRGFSLIESVVVTAIVAITAVGAFSVLYTSRSRAALQEGQASVLHAFELARSRAATGYGSADHGVHIASDSVTLFEGAAYNGSGEQTQLPFAITTNQASTTIIFKRLSALVSASGTILLSHTGGATSSIVVTKEGAIIPNP